MVGEVRVVELKAKFTPVQCEHKGQFVAFEWAVMVRKPDASIRYCQVS